MDWGDQSFNTQGTHSGNMAGSPTLPPKSTPTGLPARPIHKTAHHENTGGLIFFAVNNTKNADEETFKQDKVDMKM